MRNWYCDVHFPDGAHAVHLVPGPAPVVGSIVKLLGTEGHWQVDDIRVYNKRDDNTAAEIWVRPAAGEVEHDPGDPLRSSENH